MAFVSGLELLYLLLQAPVLLCIMAAATLAVWCGRRKHFYLLWLVAGLALLAWASYRWVSQQPWVTQPGVMYLWWAGACCVVQSIAMRFGRGVHLRLLLIASLGWLISAVYFADKGPHTRVYPFIAAWMLAVIFGHVLPLVWRSAKRHMAERVLQWVYAAVTLGLVLSPWLGAQASFTQAPWLAFLPLAAAALVGAILASALQDGAAGVRTDRYSDALIGLLNRRGFELNCGPRPSEKAITVIALCELDDFAILQQQYGMQASQLVLQKFAQLLQGSVREGDRVARVGEHEFALALCNIEVANAQVLVQRIKDSMHQQAWAHKDKPSPITVSFSVAQVRANDSLNLALHRADVLLCQAKEEGVNCLVVDEAASSAIAVFS